MKGSSIQTKPENRFFKRSHFLTVSDLDSLVLFRCDFDNTYYRRDLFGTVNIKFHSSLNNAVIKRQAEFLAGRYSATMALRELGCKNTEIPIGKHRSPIWPEGIAASITHTNSSALCAAAHRRDIEYLGIDLENWLAYDTIQEIKSSIIENDEWDLLCQSPIGLEKAFTLTFSAKECLFKALYPVVGYYFDFTAAEIVDISFKQRTFVLVLRQNLTSKLTSGTHYRGHFKFDSHSVLTVLACNLTEQC